MSLGDTLDKGQAEPPAGKGVPPRGCSIERLKKPGDLVGRDDRTGIPHFEDDLRPLGIDMQLYLAAFRAVLHRIAQEVQQGPGNQTGVPLQGWESGFQGLFNGDGRSLREWL